jgi:periplasmic protein TonB
MSDKYVEKIFLYLLLVSLLVHAGLIALIILLPEEKQQKPESPYMVELRDLPLPPEPPAPPVVRKKGAERPSPAKPEPSPETRTVAPPQPPEAPLMPLPERTVKSPDTTRQPEVSRQPETGPKAPAAKAEPEERFVIRKKETGPDLAKLFPSGRGMAAIEDSFRKKYGVKVGGDTLFLDQGDDILGSFSRRFLEAVRGRWQVNGRQLIMNNDTGYGLLLITINRSGMVEEVRVVESSGNGRVDAEIIRTVKTAGYVGPLPKKWPYEKVQGYYIYSAGYEIRN